MANILLVEDDNNLREIYEARLKAEGYGIVGASNGEEALVVAKKEQPDLVIADVMMPRISGFEMLDILRNTPGLEKVKVVMLTALGQAEDKTRADSLGADRYLVKSQVTLEDIVKAASDLLGGGQAAAPQASQPVQTATGPGGSAQQQPQPNATPPPPTQPPQQAAPAAQQTQPPANQPAAQPEPAPTVQPAPQPAAENQQTPAPAPAPRAAPQPNATTPQLVPTQPQSQPQPQTPPSAAPSQAPQTPPPAQPAVDGNTTQLSNAVKDLMSGTKNGNDAAADSSAAPTPAPQPQPQPEQVESDSVTLAGKRSIKPLGQDTAKPHINDLLAKEQTNQTNQPSPQPTTQGQLPTTPHPAGHVFSPSGQTNPQQNNNPPSPPADPNKIAL